MSTVGSLILLLRLQGMSPDEYEAKKEQVADEICERLEALWPGLRAAIEFREVCSFAWLHVPGGICMPCWCFCFLWWLDSCSGLLGVCRSTARCIEAYALL